MIENEKKETGKLGVIIEIVDERGKYTLDERKERQREREGAGKREKEISYKHVKR